MADSIVKLYQTQIKVPLPERRGVLGEVYAQSQDLLHASAEEIATSLRDNDPEVGQVLLDIGDQLDQINLPAGDTFLLIQLKGQPWTYVAGVGAAANLVSIEDWSGYTDKQALHIEHYKSEGNLAYTLYDNGDEVETFSSDGHMFFALAKDPSSEVVHEYLNRRDSGTHYETDRWDINSLDWTEYPTELHFLHETLVELDAYLNFFYARFDAASNRIELTSDDPTSIEYIERVDAVLYGATERQTRAFAVKNHPPTMALAQAISDKDLPRVVEAIGSGADINACRPGSLMCFLCHADLPITEALLNAGADPDGCQGATSPLMGLAIGKDPSTLRIAKKLLDAGADPNLGHTLLPGEDAGDSGPQTPLQAALGHGAYPMVCLLLKSGADPKIKNKRGQDALAYGQSTIDFWKGTEPVYLAEVRKAMDLLRQMLSGNIEAEDIPWPAELSD